MPAQVSLQELTSKRWIEKILTRQLLHHLDARPEDRPPQVAVPAPHRPLEARHPRPDVARLRDHLHLVLVVGHNLGQLVLDVLGIDGLAADQRESPRGRVDLALHDVETGGLGCGHVRRRLTVRGKEKHYSRRMNSPPPKMRAHTNWMPIGARYDEGLFWVDVA